MPSVCPSSCSGLATAAVLISVGVIQLLVGVILLRSEHADLLSGPDFLTASSNIGIGCVVGTAASVWKDDKKRYTSKHVARRNVLSALLLTVIVVNVTTAAVLILGEGNQLLTLYLDSSFAGQVLAGAYVTSVCSPIVCIVVAIVSLSGTCFQCQGPAAPKDSMSGAPYNWSFDPSCAPALSFLETPPSQTSDDDDDSVFDKKKSLVVNNLPTPLQSSSRRFVSADRNSSWIQKRLQLYDDRLSSHRSGDIIPRVSTDFASLSYDEAEDKPSTRQSTSASVNVVYPKKPLVRTSSRKNKLTKETLDELKAKVMSYQEPLLEEKPSKPLLSTVSLDRVLQNDSEDGKLKKSVKKLPRMKFHYGSQTLLDYADYLVDQDSLIGLSKEDLLKRTDRIRSLSKAVEVRIKNESENGSSK